MLNSPSNPTGVAYSRAELEGLGEVAFRGEAGVELLAYSTKVTPTSFELGGRLAIEL